MKSLALTGLVLETKGMTKGSCGEIGFHLLVCSFSTHWVNYGKLQAFCRFITHSDTMACIPAKIDMGQWAFES